MLELRYEFGEVDETAFGPDPSKLKEGLHTLRAVWKRLLHVLLTPISDCRRRSHPRFVRLTKFKVPSDTVGHQCCVIELSLIKMSVLYLVIESREGSLRFCPTSVLGHRIILQTYVGSVFGYRDPVGFFTMASDMSVIKS